MCPTSMHPRERERQHRDLAPLERRRRNKEQEKANQGKSRCRNAFDPLTQRPFNWTLRLQKYQSRAPRESSGETQGLI